MAQNSLNILLQTNTSVKEKLAEEWGVVFDNIAKTTISALYKNKKVTGEAARGAIMNAKRIANKTVAAYGAARTIGKGEAVKALNVPVPIDDDKEVISEVEEKDIKFYGVEGIIQYETRAQEAGVKTYYEKKFFNTGYLAGGVETLTGSTIQAKLEEVIQKIETVQNDFVDGVERSNIVLVLDTATYGLARAHIDSIQNANINSAVGEFGMFHGVIVHSSIHLPATVNYMAFAKESIAQPIIPSIYQPSKVELSDATAFGSFLYAGTTAVMPDLIFSAGTIGTIAADKATSTAAGGGETTMTVITVTETKAAAANDFYWLAGADAVAAPAWGTAVGETWTKLVLTTNAQKITTAANTKIRVAEADASGRIIKVSGEITIVNGGE